MIFLKPDTGKDDYPTTKHTGANSRITIDDVLNMVDLTGHKMEIGLNKDEANDLLNYFLSITENSRSEPRQEQARVIVTIVVNQAGQSYLTERESTILRLIADGSTTTEIGARLFLSEGTVKREVQNIFRKLDVRNRSQAVAEAHNRRLFEQL